MYHTQNAQCAFSNVICHIFCCTSKTHVLAADRSLHIKTAHPERKCNQARIVQVIVEVRRRREIGYPLIFFVPLFARSGMRSAQSEKSKEDALAAAYNALRQSSKPSPRARPDAVAGVQIKYGRVKLKKFRNFCNAICVGASQKQNSLLNLPAQESKNE
jgi:hypothetical protein